MIGWLCISVTPYYDVKLGRQSLKQRPVLIIGQADSEDFAALPVSRVTNKQYLHPYYDVPVDPAVFAASGLTVLSYVRTHKQTIVNRHAITTYMCDLRSTYPDLYVDIASKLEEYNKALFADIL